MASGWCNGGQTTGRGGAAGEPLTVGLFLALAVGSREERGRLCECATSTQRESARQAKKVGCKKRQVWPQIVLPKLNWCPDSGRGNTPKVQRPQPTGHIGP